MKASQCYVNGADTVEEAILKPSQLQGVFRRNSQWLPQACTLRVWWRWVDRVRYILLQPYGRHRWSG